MAAKRKKDKPKKKKPSRFVAIVPDRVLGQIEDLLEDEQTDAAREIVNEWLEKRPNDPILHFYAGCVNGIDGNYVQAIVHYRKAQRADRRMEVLWRNMFTAYMGLQQPIHAWRALKRYFQTEYAEEEEADMMSLEKARTSLEAFRKEVAAEKGMDVAQFDEFCYWNEEAQITQFEGDWDASIAAAGRALAALPGNAAARNNRAVSNYCAGRVDAAIKEEKEVAALHPDNVHALCNLVRFCDLAGDRASSVGYFEQVKALRPDQWESQSNPIEKMMEAYAFAGSDEEVYAFCKAHIDEMPERGDYMLGAAAANLGYVQEAVHAWESAMEFEGYWGALAEEALEALRSGKPGMGQASHFPYVGTFELFGHSQFEQVIRSLEQKVKGRAHISPGLKKHPGLLAFARWILRYGDDVQVGLNMCAFVDTDESWDEVRQFALGQAGTDMERSLAVQCLVDHGKLSVDAPVRMWIRGNWTDVALKQLVVNDDVLPPSYSDEVYHLLERAGEAIESEKLEVAKRLYLRALELHPACASAHNNLGMIARWQEDIVSARSHLEKALEIDPDYATSRCNLAVMCVEAGETDRAIALLRPLYDRTQFTSVEMKGLHIAQIKIHMAEGEADAAEKLLEGLQVFYPEDQAVLALAKELDRMRPLSGLLKWVRGRRDT